MRHKRAATHLILTLLLLGFLGLFLLPTTAHAETPNYLDTVQLPVDTELVANSVSVDTEGSRIVVGEYSGSATFALGEIGETTITSNGSSDIFIAKFDNTGQFLWVVSLGGTGEDRANSVTTSSIDNAAYIVGTFSDEVYFNDEEIGLPAKDAPSLQTSEGFMDSYALKYTSSGLYSWVYAWGNSSDQESARAVALDSAQNVFVVGTMDGDVDFDHEPMTAQGSVTNGGYILKLDNSSTFVWTMIRGGPTLEFNSVAIDSNDRVITVGQFTNSVTFQTDIIDAEIFTSSGQSDAFVFRVTNGGEFHSAKFWGGSEADIADDVVVGPDDELYISGYFATTTDFDPGAGTQSSVSAGEIDAYALSLNSSLAYVWHETWGGSGSEILNALYLPNSAGAQLYGIGRYEDSVAFEPGNSSTDTANGFEDLYAISFSTAGVYDWHTVWGGTDSDIATDLAYGPTDTLSLTGYFQGQVDFNFSAGSDVSVADGTNDGFLTTYTMTAEASAGAGSSNTSQTEQGLSAPTTPSCPDTAPTGTPDLFQIARNGSSATLYFSPVTNSATSYYISYGLGDNSEGYGVSFPYSDSSGVISYTINALDPTKTYTFKVRAGNGCATGLWSSWLKSGIARTQLANTSSSAGFSVVVGVGLLVAGYVARKLTQLDDYA